MMNKIKFFGVVFLLVIMLSSCVLTSADDRVGIYVNIGTEGIQSVEIDFLRDDRVVSTTGCANADNTPMKIGQMFGFDKPEYGKSDFSLQIKLKTTAGEEIKNEKTKVSLPGGFDKYELEIVSGNNGDYRVKLLSSERIDVNG